MPECSTPLLRPLACRPTSRSFSRRTMRADGERFFSSRAIERPTIPAPAMTKSKVSGVVELPVPLHESRDAFVDARPRTIAGRFFELRDIGHRRRYVARLHRQ